MSATTSTDLCCRIDADDRVPAAVHQSIDGSDPNPVEVVGGVVGLNAHSEDAALSHRVAQRVTTRMRLAAMTRSLLLISFATADAISGRIARCRTRYSSSLRSTRNARGTRRRSATAAAQRLLIHVLEQ